MKVITIEGLIYVVCHLVQELPSNMGTVATNKVKAERVPFLFSFFGCCCWHLIETLLRLLEQHFVDGSFHRTNVPQNLIIFSTFQEPVRPILNLSAQLECVLMYALLFCVFSVNFGTCSADITSLTIVINSIINDLSTSLLMLSF